MRSNYKQLGKCIRKVNTRNIGLKTTNLLGINIDKFFMPSVANVVGTDMSTYKIVQKGQFACNRMHVGRDYRLPISITESSEDFLVSPAYDVFEVKDTEELLPEYLMMWFTRKEYDRNAWFYTDADVRGGLNWNAFSEMELPVPHINKQREIVSEYSVLVDRINLNNQFIQKLEETAQAIYKQWFIDFEFPNENGKPYKSNGGEMEFNEELDKDIPKGWKVGELGKMLNPKKGRNITREQVVEGEIPVVAGGVEPSCFHNKSNTESPVVTISASGANAGYVRLYNEKVWSSDSSFIDKTITPYVFFSYVFLKINQGELTHMQTGTGQPHIYPEHIKSLKIVNIPELLLIKYENLVEALFTKYRISEKENIIFINMKNLLLSKLTTINH